MLAQCQTRVSTKPKVNGLSFVASRDTIRQQHIEPVLKMHANWVSLMPFGFMKSIDNPNLQYDHPRQWYGERIEGVRQSINIMHNNDIKVMLKPQIWIGNGDFTGHIQMKSEKDWQEFEQQYKSMLINFAKLAEETRTEMLCLGTELHNFVEQRPEFWSKLIVQVKEVYSGQLTYAENWDKYTDFPFWSSLDFIGVDAYFPVSDNQTPHLEEVHSRWEIIKSGLKSLSQTHNRPVLFTEFGYRSIDFAGKEPWNSKRIDGQVNEEAQAILIQGLMESVWQKKWFAGGFLWKWFHDPEKYRDWQDNRFSIYGKEAEDELRNIYKNQ
jgi:hypothetical protein